MSAQRDRAAFARGVMATERHDCGGACDHDGRGVDPKLFELQGRHDRLVSAGTALMHSGSLDSRKGRVQVPGDFWRLFCTVLLESEWPA